MLTRRSAYNLFDLNITDKGDARTRNLQWIIGLQVIAAVLSALVIPLSSFQAINDRALHTGDRGPPPRHFTEKVMSFHKCHKDH